MISLVNITGYASDETTDEDQTVVADVEPTSDTVEPAADTEDDPYAKYYSDDTIFDYGGNYSINYILNNFNIFTKEDAICGHTIGAVAVGGAASFQMGIGRDNYTHTTPSYFAGGFTAGQYGGTGFNSYLGKNTIDVVIANNSKLPRNMSLFAKSEGKDPVEIDAKKIEKMGVQLIEEKLFKVEEGYIRHNSLKTAFLMFSYLMENEQK